MNDELIKHVPTAVVWCSRLSIAITCFIWLASCAATPEVDGYGLFPDLDSIDFLRGDGPSETVRVTPIGLRLTYEPIEYADPPGLGAWYLTLDLALSGSEDQVSRIGGVLISGFVHDSGQFVRVRGPVGSSVELAPPVRERPGYEHARIDPRGPGFHVEHIDRVRVRALEPVGIDLKGPPPDGIYRVQLLPDAIRQFAEAVFGIDPTKIVVDDRWHEFELTRMEYRRGLRVMRR